MKHGDYFSAEIQGVRLFGRISVEGGGIFLCQNEHDGAVCDNRLGMSYSYTISSGSEREMSREGVTNLKIITEAAFRKGMLKAKSIISEKFFGWNVKKERNTYIFGCGAVKVTKKQVEDFLAVNKDKSAKMMNYRTIVEIMKQNSISNDETTVSRLNALIKL